MVYVTKDAPGQAFSRPGDKASLHDQYRCCHWRSGPFSLERHCHIDARQPRQEMQIWSDAGTCEIACESRAYAVAEPKNGEKTSLSAVGYLSSDRDTREKRSNGSSGPLKIYSGLITINHDGASYVSDLHTESQFWGTCIMRTLIAVLVIAIAFPLVGCAAPVGQQANTVRESQHPYNLLVPSEVLPAFI
jgi:hypothetical protein